MRDVRVVLVWVIHSSNLCVDFIGKLQQNFLRRPVVLKKIVNFTNLLTQFKRIKLQKRSSKPLLSGNKKPANRCQLRVL